MEASAFRVAANLEHVNPELEPYFMPMAEKLMADGGVAKLAQALAWMSGYKSPPSKRSLQTGEDELRTVQLKPDEKGDVQVRAMLCAHSSSKHALVSATTYAVGDACDVLHSSSKPCH